jgi:hypothetical protein
MIRKWLIKSLAVSIVLTVSGSFAQASVGSSNRLTGGSGTGGGQPAKIDYAVITSYIHGAGLKSALLNYLNSLPLINIKDSSVASIFSILLQDQRLQKDILTPGNYVASDSCSSGTDPSSLASATFGDVGGKICFDVRKLANSYANLSEEQLLIRLASLALHEHVHHFQAPTEDNSLLLAYEDEAYSIAAYVNKTARLAQEPTLRWEDPEGKKPGTILNKNQAVEGYKSLQVNSDGSIVVTEPYVLYEGQKVLINGRTSISADENTPNAHEIRFEHSTSMYSTSPGDVICRVAFSKKYVSSEELKDRSGFVAIEPIVSLDKNGKIESSDNGYPLGKLICR